MGSEGEAFVPKPSCQDDKPNENVEIFLSICFVVCLFVCIIVGMVFLFIHIDKQDREDRERERKEAELYVPDITIQSMYFTVLNVTETRLSVNWDLVIRIPSRLSGYYMCIYGDFQVYILYKGATIATSSRSYNLVPDWPQQLKVSVIASEGDMDGGVAVKDIMDVIKDKGKMKFGSQLVVPDCRPKSSYEDRSAKMKYNCDEAMLKFSSQRNATLSGNLPTCHHVR